MGKRKFRGHDPARKARQDYEARRNPAMWGTNEDALKLAQNGDVHSVPETRTTTRRVQRFDCFATLKLSDHQFTAIRRYQTDLALSYGVGDKPAGPVVDASVPDAELKEFRALTAGGRVLDLYRALSQPDSRLLWLLSHPVWVEGGQANWKAIVRAERGLIDRDAQASCVKTLSENVRLAYAEIDNPQQRKAA